MYLTRDQILATADLPAEDVEVPEWGGTVRVRTMTAAERDVISGITDDIHFMERLVAVVVIDEAGNRVFSDADVEALGKKSAHALTRVFRVGLRLSSMQAGAVDGAVKNSGASAGDTSSSS